MILRSVISKVCFLTVPRRGGGDPDNVTSYRFALVCSPQGRG